MDLSFASVLLHFDLKVDSKRSWLFPGDLVGNLTEVLVATWNGQVSRVLGWISSSSLVVRPQDFLVF